ncbi:putative nuclease HARBI1 isoform X1 [Ixodes scapularis]
MGCNASAPSRRTMDCTPIFQLLYPVDRRNRSHRDAFELPEHVFRKQYRLAKTLVRWLCDELREEPELQRLRRSSTVMTVEDQVLCALRFYATGSFQGTVASDEHIARDQGTVSIALRAVSVAIVRRLGIQHGWIHFPQTASERDDFERGFQLLGRIPGVIGCIDGTMISIVGPSKYDPTVTKAAYWCRKQYYALNVMVVCDARCRVMCIDPCYPGSVHDSFAWRFSWLRDNFDQGRLIDDGRFLLGSYAQVLHRGPARPMVSTGTQTSMDDLRLPSRSAASSGAVPVTPLSNRKVDAASSASTSGQGLTPPAPPGPLVPKGRGLPPRTSAPQRKPGEQPKQSTSEAQLPAATYEPMDGSGPRSEEDAPLSGSESSLSVASTYMNSDGHVFLLQNVLDIISRFTLPSLLVINL